MRISMGIYLLYIYIRALNVKAAGAALLLIPPTPRGSS